MEVLEDRMLLNASPEIVADINPGASNSGATGLTDVGGTLFLPPMTILTVMNFGKVTARRTGPR